MCVCLDVCRYEACCPNLKRPTESPVTKGRSSPSMATLLTPCRLTHVEMCVCLPLGKCVKLILLCTRSVCTAHGKPVRRDYCKNTSVRFAHTSLCGSWSEVCVHTCVHMYSTHGYVLNVFFRFMCICTLHVCLCILRKTWTWVCSL